MSSRHRFSVLLSPLLGLVAISCASSGSPPPSDPEPAAPIAETAPADEGSAGTEASEPPAADLPEAWTAEDAGRSRERHIGHRDEDFDDEWLVDEETGLEYQIEEVEKREGWYRRLDDDRVQLALGVIMEVVDETDTHFLVKYFKPLPRPEPQPVDPGPTEEELTAVAATFESDIASVDRLRLEPFDEGLPRAGQWRDGFDIADVDGDGELDIVSGPYRKGPAVPHVFRGDGAGNWTRWDADFGGLAYDYGDAATGDLDGDGVLDIVFGVHLRGILAVRQVPGEDRFEPWTEGIEFDVPGRGGRATAFSSRQVETIDWDGDGRLDIFALGEGPKGRVQDRSGDFGVLGSSRGLVVYRNLGEGRWEPHALPDARVFGSDAVLADFDGDGLVDVAVASRTGGDRELIYLRREDGSVRPQLLEGLPDRAFVEAVAPIVPASGGPAALVVGYRVSTLGVWRTGLEILSGPDFGDRSVLRALEVRDGISSIAVGDVDGDGRRDILAGTGSGALWLFLGTEDGGFEAEEMPELPTENPGCAVAAIRLADLDRDGRDEIVAAFAGERVGITALPGLSKPGCIREGSLRSWKVAAGGS